VSDSNFQPLTPSISDATPLYSECFWLSLVID
jgi:hypothetical protein